MVIHDFDMARFLMDEEPVAVFSSASCLIDPAIGAAGDVDTDPLPRRFGRKRDVAAMDAESGSA